MARTSNERSDAPTIYPLGHPRNPTTAAAAGVVETKRAPRPHSEKVAADKAAKAAAKAAQSAAAESSTPPDKTGPPPAPEQKDEQ